MHPKGGQAEQRCSLQPGMAKWTPAKPNAAFRTAHEGILNSAGFCSKGEFQTARDFLLSMRPKGVAVNVGPIKTRLGGEAFFWITPVKLGGLRWARGSDLGVLGTSARGSPTPPGVPADPRKYVGIIMPIVASWWLWHNYSYGFLGRPQTPSKRSLVEVDRKSIKHCLPGLVSAMFLARLQIPEFWDPGILTLRSPQTPSKVGAEVLRFP